MTRHFGRRTLYLEFAHSLKLYLTILKLYLFIVEILEYLIYPYLETLFVWYKIKHKALVVPRLLTLTKKVEKVAK